MTEPATPPDVTIIGAGIVGCCCALSALEAGFSVAVLDRDPPGSGASHGNAGVVSPWSCVPQSVPGVLRQLPGWLLDPSGPVRVRPGAWPQLATWGPRFFLNARPDRLAAICDGMADLIRDAIPAYRRWLDAAGRGDLLRDSVYVNAFRHPDRPDLDAPGFRLRRERGAPLEIVEADALHALEPALSEEYTSGIVIRDQARATAPGALTRALADAAQARGAAFERVEIQAIEADADGTLTLCTARGARPVRKLVLAAGIASTTLLRPLGYRMPMIAERGYHVEFPDPGVAINYSLMDVAGKVVASTMEGGLRVAGTSDIAPVGAPPDMRRADALVPLAKRLLPGLQTDGMRRWSGVRPSLPDSLPAIGPMPGLPNLVAAFGHSHYGMSMAPGTARLVAYDLAGRAGNSDAAAYRPDRYVRRR